MIEGSGGDFIVIADGQELWHKRQTQGAFPGEAEIIDKLGEAAS